MRFAARPLAQGPILPPGEPFSEQGPYGTALA